MNTKLLSYLALISAAICNLAYSEPAQTAFTPAIPTPVVVPENVELLHDLVIGTGGGRPLHAEIARPIKTPSQPMPAIILIHGGGWRTGSHRDSKMYLFFAAHGYFAASVEYRLSGEAKWPAQIEDCKLAVRWLRANADKYHIDPDRIAAIGGSAGGHLAICLGVMGDKSEFEGEGGYSGVSSKVHAVIDINGPTSLTQDKLHLFGFTFAEKPELYKAASPINYVRAELPPFLVFHGDKDDVVPFTQSSTFVEALQKAGAKVKFVVVKDGGHDLTAIPADKEMLWSESLSWLNENMK